VAARTESFVRNVVDALREHGQVATQFVTAHLESDPGGLPDVVFSPDSAEGRVVCAEFYRTTAPTLVGIQIARIQRHREAILAANSEVEYVLVTNATVREPAPARLKIIQTDWMDAGAAAEQIRWIATS
jgi:hypothetical protein